MGLTEKDQNRNVESIIIDTDPGMDDAMAIMLALKEHKKGNVKVLAITLVSGNSTTDNAQINILRVLEIFGLEDEIPVYVGATRGLVEEYNHEGPPFHGEDGFGNTKFDKIPDLTKIKKDESACLAILKVVKSMPGEVTIIGLGPLTNLAACINASPDFASQLKRLLLMGGNSHGEGNITVCGEFNFHADPEAAKVVIDRIDCPVCIAPWETCRNTNLTWDWRKNVLGKIDSPQIRLLNRVEEMWENNRPTGDAWIPCDQVIMSIFLDGTVIKESDTFQATVELHGYHTRGQLVLEKRSKNLINSNKPKKKETNEASKNAGMAHVVLSVDVEKLKDCLMNGLR